MTNTTYHIILKKDPTGFTLPDQYTINTFFITYEFYQEFSPGMPYIPNYSNFLSAIEMLAVRRVHITGKDNRYTQIILRNMSKGDEVHLALLGLITPDSYIKVPETHDFYETLQRDLPKENQYFVINNLDIIPDEYFKLNVKFIHASVSDNTGPIFWTFKEHRYGIDAPINEGMGYIIQLLVNLTEEDKTHLKLLNVPLQLEERPERIIMYNQVFNFGTAVERFNNLINVSSESK